METLVDELCIKLKELEGGSSRNEKEESKKSSDEPKTNLEALTPRDRALRYYAAFPALQSVSIKKSSPQKNFANSNNNKNNGISLHNNKNNSARNKKTKMSLVSIIMSPYLFDVLYSYHCSKLLFFSFFRALNHNNQKIKKALDSLNQWNGREKKNVNWNSIN